MNNLQHMATKLYTLNHNYNFAMSALHEWRRKNDIMKQQLQLCEKKVKDQEDIEDQLRIARLHLILTRDEVTTLISKLEEKEKRLKEKQEEFVLMQNRIHMTEKKYCHSQNELTATQDKLLCTEGELHSTKDKLMIHPKI